MSLRKRLSVAVQAAVTGAKTVVTFTASIPGRVRRFIALSPAERKEVYRGWWNTVKTEAKHYWVGTKLLWADIKIATRLLQKVVRGKALSRRERRQLTRTTADMFRLVPFAIFLLVPFMELLLPVALKLFPNMLPSTFEDKLKKEEELKKRVGVKLEVARFLQGTIQEMAKDMRSSGDSAVQASAEELYQFMKRVRAGEPVSNFEIMRFAQLFNDELTLDNLERIHLVNLCRFVGISPFGTDAFLVARLRTHLARIKQDDRAIKEEGLDSLTEEELRSACRTRGMRTPFGEGAVTFMRKQMQEWLDLSLNRALPSSLLLLSRAFTVTQPMVEKPRDADLQNLRETMSALPNKVIAEISMEATAKGPDKVKSLERKLEYLRREDELIREEELEAEALLGPDSPSIQPGQTAQEITAAAAASAIVREATASAVMDVLEGESEEEKSSKLAAAKEDKMRKVISALAVLASSSGVSKEREAFMELVRHEIDRLNQQFTARGSVSMVFHAGGLKVERPTQLQEVVGTKRLADKVSTILARIEKELDQVDSKIGESMHVLDLDNDGMITRDELRAAMGFLTDQLGEDELRHLLERLNAFNEEEEASPIPVAELMSLAQELGASPRLAAKKEPAKLEP
ncbi:hypothetical protein WJX72_001831 [[Myrmecia] bisecta]|uniref:Mitochondrial proton/calcium exchanger protein n=1 Tax=[Myrmecia] bisecta TaxID=41462 RepID=A0AAW1PG19_9CHLO